MVISLIVMTADSVVVGVVVLSVVLAVAAARYYTKLVASIGLNAYASY